MEDWIYLILVYWILGVISITQFQRGYKDVTAFNILLNVLFFWIFGPIIYVGCYLDDITVFKHKSKREEK